jgi:hypothetical protein
LPSPLLLLTKSLSMRPPRRRSRKSLFNSTVPFSLLTPVAANPRRYCILTLPAILHPISLLTLPFYLVRRSRCPCSLPKVLPLKQESVCTFFLVLRYPFCLHIIKRQCYFCLRLWYSSVMCLDGFVYGRGGNVYNTQCYDVVEVLQ